MNEKLNYDDARKFIFKHGVATRKEYLDLRLLNTEAFKLLPSNPNQYKGYQSQWNGWTDFLRNTDLVPKGAKKIVGHYYLYKGDVYNNKNGFKLVKKRKHPDGYYMAEVRLDTKTRKTFYLGRWKPYLTAEELAHVRKNKVYTKKPGRPRKIQPQEVEVKNN
nr:hypothetical protein [uncultured Flavobacterium sp.]